MSANAKLLFANEAFYTAFQTSDSDAMEALWARDLPVACIHPGWPALSGREEVMESWRDILGGEAAPEIRCRQARAFVQGESGFVICYEIMGNSVLIASNLFVREAGEWRMVHHQAGPCNRIPESLKEPEEAARMQ